MDHDADVNFADLLEQHCHLRPNSDYHRRFDEAAQITSQADNRRNQTIKYLRQSLMFEALSTALRNGTAGEFADCGCFRGQSTHMIASLMQHYSRTERLHAFDSFQGLSSFAPQDNEGLERSERQIERLRLQFAFSLETFKQNLGRFPFVNIHAGWIPDTFGYVTECPFAFVHVDVDLYEPTRDCLAFFYPRLKQGGFIVVDDYNAPTFPGATTAVDEFLVTYKPAFALPGSAGGFVIGK